MVFSFHSYITFLSCLSLALWAFLTQWFSNLCPLSLMSVNLFWIIHTFLFPYVLWLFWLKILFEFNYVVTLNIRLSPFQRVYSLFDCCRCFILVISLRWKLIVFLGLFCAYFSPWACTVADFSYIPCCLRMCRKTIMLPL